MNQSTETTSKKLPRPDQIIILIGEELDYLYQQLKQNQPYVHESCKAQNIENSICNRLNDLTHAVAALPASTPEAAAIQIRALHSELVNDEESNEHRVFLLMESVLDFIQQQGGPKRHDYAGEYFLKSSSALDVYFNEQGELS